MRTVASIISPSYLCKPVMSSLFIGEPVNQFHETDSNWQKISRVFFWRAEFPSRTPARAHAVLSASRCFTKWRRQLFDEFARRKARDQRLAPGHSCTGNSNLSVKGWVAPRQTRLPWGRSNCRVSTVPNSTPKSCIMRCGLFSLADNRLCRRRVSTCIDLSTLNLNLNPECTAPRAIAFERLSWVQCGIGMGIRVNWQEFGRQSETTTLVDPRKFTDTGREFPKRDCPARRRFRPVCAEIRGSQLKLRQWQVYHGGRWSGRWKHRHERTGVKER